MTATHPASLNQGTNPTDPDKISTTTSTGDLYPGIVDFRHRAHSHRRRFRFTMGIRYDHLPQITQSNPKFRPLEFLEDRRSDTNS